MQTPLNLFCAENHEWNMYATRRVHDFTAHGFVYFCMEKSGLSGSSARG